MYFLYLKTSHLDGIVNNIIKSLPNLFDYYRSHFWWTVLLKKDILLLLFCWLVGDMLFCLIMLIVTGYLVSNWRWLCNLGDTEESDEVDEGDSNNDGGSLHSERADKDEDAPYDGESGLRIS